MTWNGDPSLAISPLDGRYSKRLDPLRMFFSEFALNRERCRVEIRFAMALDETGVFPKLNDSEKQRCEQMLGSFGPQEYEAIKLLESTLNHDVKSCEVFLRDALVLANPNRIHFGLTSEDVNNLAYSCLLKQYVDTVQKPLWREFLARLGERIVEWRTDALPARTHGQHATPTTAGKEVAVLANRALRYYGQLCGHSFRGKLNGATGNYSALLAAAPDVDWEGFSRRFVNSLGLEFNPLTTQIEDHDAWADYFNIVRQFNNVVMDLDQDFWLYISYGYLVQALKPGEVGSSTMPHKVNPIFFENSEGNLQISNTMLAFLADKLCRSRMQRDLTDSTVSRNLGVALGHHHLAVNETLRGLGRVRLNRELCLAELQACPELLAEPIQTVLRTLTGEDAYTQLKHLTRGQSMTPELLASFIDQLAVKDEVKQRLRELKPETYLGKAAELCDDITARLYEVVAP